MRNKKSVGSNDEASPASGAAEQRAPGRGSKPHPPDTGGDADKPPCSTPARRPQEAVSGSAAATATTATGTASADATAAAAAAAATAKTAAITAAQATAAASKPAAAPAEASNALPRITGSKHPLEHRAGAAGPPTKRLGAQLKAIPVMCSPPSPEQLAAKRLKELDRQGGSRGGAPKRAKGAAGQGPSGSADDADTDVEEPIERGGGGVAAGSVSGGETQRAGTIYGVFHPDRYLNGEDCIDYQGNFITRSKFEKLGGSLMAKWYRSIRVVATGEALGTWLTRRGMPVLKGNPRNRRSAAAAKEMDAGDDGSGGGDSGCQRGRAAAGHGLKGTARASAEDEESAPACSEPGPVQSGDGAAAAEPAGKPDPPAPAAAAKPAARSSCGAAPAPAAATTDAVTRAWASAAAAETVAAAGSKAESGSGSRSRSTTSRGSIGAAEVARPAEEAVAAVAAALPPPGHGSGDPAEPLHGSASGAAPPAANHAAAAADVGGLAGAAGPPPPSEHGRNVSPEPRGPAGPCWSAMPRATCPAAVYGDNAVRHGTTGQQRGSPNSSSQVSSDERLQISGTSYGAGPAVAAAVTAGAVGATTAATAAAAVAGGPVSAAAAAATLAVVAPEPLTVNGVGGVADAAVRGGGVRSVAWAAGPTAAAAEVAAAARGGGPVGIGGPPPLLPPPHWHPPCDDGDAAWQRWSWSNHGQGREVPGHLLRAGSAASQSGYGPLHLRTSIPGGIEAQPPYRASAPGGSGGGGPLQGAGTVAAAPPASAASLPSDLPCPGPFAAPGPVAAPTPPQQHHSHDHHRQPHVQTLPHPQRRPPPMYPQRLPGPDAPSPWHAAPPSAPTPSGQVSTYTGPCGGDVSGGTASSGDGGGGGPVWHPQHQQQTPFGSPPSDRVGKLLSLGAPAALEAPPRGPHPPLNRIELVKMELLRGARGAGASMQPLHPPLLQASRGALQLRSAVPDSFEARVECLLRGARGSGAAAVAAAALPAGRGLGHGVSGGGGGTAAAGMGVNILDPRRSGGAAVVVAGSHGHWQGPPVYGHGAMGYDTSTVHKPTLGCPQAVGLQACGGVAAPEALAWHRPMGHMHPFSTALWDQ